MSAQPTQEKSTETQPTQEEMEKATLGVQKIIAYIISLTLLPSFFGFHSIPMGTWFAPVFYIGTAFITGGLSCVICAPADVIFFIIATPEKMKIVYDGSWQSRIIPPSMLYMYRLVQLKSEEEEQKKQEEEKKDE